MIDLESSLTPKSSGLVQSIEGNAFGLSRHVSGALKFYSYHGHIIPQIAALKWVLTNISVLFFCLSSPFVS